MDYSEIYLKLFIAFAALVALYFLVGPDETDNSDS